MDKYLSRFSISVTMLLPILFLMWIIPIVKPQFMLAYDVKEQ